MVDGPVATAARGWGPEPQDELEAAGIASTHKVDELSFVEWLERYSIGRLGPSDQTPQPPAPIAAILDGRASAGLSTPSSPVLSSPLEDPPSSASKSAARHPLDEKPRRGPLAIAITLSQGSNQPSPANSEDSASIASLVNPAVTDETAAELLEHYRKFGTFPAPKGPWEQERLQLAHKYGLDQPIRRKAIDRICAIAKAHFKTKMVVVSLTLDDYQVLGAERGFAPNAEPTLEDPLRPLSIEPAFCTHAMAASYKDPRGVFVVADANKDWRFARNPYSTKNGGGVSFYAAANVNLPTGGDADKRGLPQTLASGALCLMDGHKTLRDPSEFTAEDRAVLSDLAEMIAREFQLGFEQRRREEEAKQSEFLGQFLQQALVQPAQHGCLRGVNPDSSTSSYSHRSTPLDSLDREDGEQSGATNLEDRPFEFPSQPPTPGLHTEEKTRVHLEPSSARESGPTAEPSAWKSAESSYESSSLAPSLFTTAARNMMTLTRSQSCGILDLRGFHSAHYRPQPNVMRSSVSMSPTQANAFVAPFPSPSQIAATATLLGKDANVSAANSPRASRTRTESFGVGVSKANRGKIGLMASQGAVDWRSIIKRSSRWDTTRAEQAEARGTRVDEAEAVEDPLVLAVEETLRIHASMSPDEIDNHGFEGAFVACSILPKSTSDTYCVPIFDVDGSPALMIVLSSSEKWFRFEPSDRRFLESVGAVLVGSMLRERARESDRAKLAFISQVSHEVRTPLYGVASQLSLIREFSSPHELRKLAPLLDVAEICVDSLSSVLEDTLDFSKLSNVSEAEEANLRQRRLAEVDLVTLIEGVLTSTWIKKKRADLVSVDLGGMLETERSEQEHQGKIDLILEVDDKQDGWNVLTDVGGLRRILLNIVGNALKFTRSGHVKVTLRYLGRPSATTPDLLTPRPRVSSLDQGSYRGYVVFVVEDTGIGMSPEFLREGQLFTPFKQADSFSSGVGLGLSICDSMVKRLGPGRIDVSSELGVGTEFSVTLPMDFVCSTAAADHEKGFPFSVGSRQRPETSTRKVISSQLNQLFGHASDILPPTKQQSQGHPASATADDAARPPPVPSSVSSGPPAPVDFPSAVAALHSTLSSILEAEADPNNSPDELAIEAAKLAIAATQQVESSVIPMSSPSAVEKGPEVADLANGTGPTNGDEVRRMAREKRQSSVAPDIHVLFADDNPVARNILTKLFTGKGIKFSAAEDGQQAVDLFSAGGGSISLIFMDVQMPVMDGIGASHAIREIELERGWDRSRIIALTGLSNESDIAEAAEGGVDKWLVKGGKSLRVIMEEVADVQKELENRASDD